MIDLDRGHPAARSRVRPSPCVPASHWHRGCEVLTGGTPAPVVGEQLPCLQIGRPGELLLTTYNITAIKITRNSPNSSLAWTDTGAQAADPDFLFDPRMTQVDYFSSSGLQIFCVPRQLARIWALLLWVRATTAPLQPPASAPSCQRLPRGPLGTPSGTLACARSASPCVPADA